MESVSVTTAGVVVLEKNRLHVERVEWWTGQESAEEVCWLSWSTGHLFAEGDILVSVTMNQMIPGKSFTGNPQV